MYWRARRSVLGGTQSTRYTIETRGPYALLLLFGSALIMIQALAKHRLQHGNTNTGGHQQQEEAHKGHNRPACPHGTRAYSLEKGFLRIGGKQ